eukprot:gnl/MRDRNA2_/MRDRNA2_87413_c0_seq1.p1 gnl/MRDRNA2_/MRDRNA2_87413_c0~~gnl/MRDRNA2_/MRDRNA2_87413_c0_seq1.p1  ORF type:complete len:417 (+),score=158.29 gnl/MRDRNA2_/MRDRNA2_87413_c0_seq1:62-1312(+)
MRYLVIAAVVALALARPHPHPHPRNDVAKSVARERRAEIAEGLSGAASSIRAVAKKSHGSKGHAKPVDPEAAEKAREMAEREEKAKEESKKQSEELKKQLEEKRLAKMKLANDMKQMHKAMVETTTTTTAVSIDTHILDVSEEAKPKAAPPTPAQLAKIAEEKNEQAEHAREVEEAREKEAAKERKAQAEAKKLKEQEKRLHAEAGDLKKDAPRANDGARTSVQQDEEAAAKMIKAVGQVHTEVAVSAPVSIAPEEKKVEVPKVVQEAYESAKKVLMTKTQMRSKAAIKKTAEEIESEVHSNAESLHAAVMDAEAKKVAADMKQQEDSLKEVKNAQRMAMKEEAEQAKEAKKQFLKQQNSQHHQMFKPHPQKFNPQAPEEVAKRAVEEDGRREGALQSKMEDMMGNMEKIRAEISH